MNYTTNQLLGMIASNPYMANDTDFMEAIRACIKDAERYRYARDEMSPLLIDEIWAGAHSGQDIDADIDRAKEGRKG